MTKMMTMPPVASGSSSGPMTFWMILSGAGSGSRISTGTGRCSSCALTVAPGALAAVSAAFCGVSLISRPSSLSMVDARPMRPPSVPRSACSFPSIVRWYCGRFCPRLVSCEAMTAPIPKITRKANTTVTITEGIRPMKRRNRMASGARTKLRSPASAKGIKMSRPK